MADSRRILLNNDSLDELARGLSQENRQSWPRLVQRPGNAWAIETEADLYFSLDAAAIEKLAMVFWTRNDPPTDDDLAAAIGCMSRSLDATAEGDAQLLARLLDISEYYRCRYNRRHQIADLHSAVRMIERASTIIAPSHPQYSDFLRIYGEWALLDSSLLDEAITRFHESCNLMVEDSNLFQFYANMLHCRYERDNGLEDLKTAIKVSEEISVSTNSPKIKVYALANLAQLYGQLYDKEPDLIHLEQAVERGHQASRALGEPPSLSLDDAYVFGALAFAYRSRYLHIGERPDLENAIFEGEKACQLAVDDDPGKPSWFNNLADAYELLFELSGAMGELDRAIGLMEDSIQLTPSDGPSKARRLNNLANKLGRRFDWTNEMEYLDQSIEKYEEAAGNKQQSPAERATYSQNLGFAYMQRYTQEKNPQDVRNSVDLMRKAISYFGEGSIFNPPCYRLLGKGLEMLSRTETTNPEDDVTEARKAYEMAVSLCLKGQPYRASYLLAQGQFYANQFERHGCKRGEDLETAIVLIEEALVLAVDDTPERGQALLLLGNLLSMRFVAEGKPQDIDLGLSYYQKAAEMPNGYPLLRIKAARFAIRLLKTTENWVEMKSLGEKALEILPLVCGRYQRLHDQQEALLQTSGLAADVCSILLKMGNPEDALRKLEFGKGILIGYMIDNHDDLKALRESGESGADLAKKYESIRRRLYLSPEDPEPKIDSSQMQDRRVAARDMEKCLERIRQTKGNEDFLRELPVDQMKTCANEGPIVVVNITDINSNAILISTTRVHAIALPNIETHGIPDFLSTSIRDFGSHQESAQRDGKLKIKSDSFQKSMNSEASLAWLWRTCVKVVLDEMNASGMISATGALPRIWWIGSGVASHFPFHAAAGSQDGEDALSQMIPSYTPSIKTLLHSRQRSQEYQQFAPKNNRVTVVAMAKTPGHIDLPGVTEESDAIKNACATNYNCRVLEQPDVQLVLQSIVDSDIMHFACHGSSDIKTPTQSHLMLQRAGEHGDEIDKLSVSKILGVMGGRFAWISFLSACSTAETQGSELADEGLHVSSALQLAGFPHVIGSIWPVDDKVSVHVASSFYKNLINKGGLGLGNREVAEALRESVLDARKRYSEPRKWAAYIHSGA